jgi:hypothetical protein
MDIKGNKFNDHQIPKKGWLFVMNDI